MAVTSVISEDGSQYKGQFAHGKPHGEGIRSDASGNEFTGQFAAVIAFGQVLQRPQQRCEAQRQ